MNDERLTTLERQNNELAFALRRLTDIFSEDTPGRYSIAVEFDGGDGCVSIIGAVSLDESRIIEDSLLALERYEAEEV